MVKTIDDIAKKAKVSKATVSRVINNSGYVGDTTRERVEKVIKENNYVPSVHARSLSKQDSDVIGVVVPEAENPFFGEVLTGISEIAEKNGLAILYCNTGKSEAREKRALKMLRQQRIKGLIITPTTEGKYSDGYAQDFKNLIDDLRVPVILLDRDVDPSWSGVFTDSYRGAYICTKLLIDSGHKKIGIVTGDLTLGIAKKRLEGYKGAMNDAKLPIQDKYIYEGDFEEYKAYEVTKELLQDSDKPTALVTSNNLTTIGTIKAILEAGLKIPDDIALVGFDDIKMIEFMNLHITVAERKTIQMGHEAMELLLQIISDRNSHTKQNKITRIVIVPEIIKRGSEIKNKKLN